MNADRIAFLTTAIGLTCEEAEKFWPVYNEASAEKDKAFEAIHEAYRVLCEAVRSGKSDKATLAKLVDEYLVASQRPSQIDRTYVAKYRKVLSDEKVAKLFVAEEDFRRHQIGKLQKGPQPPKGGDKATQR